MANVISVLKERGLIEAMTSEELHKAAEQPLRVYCGFDPTADSLHLGNMIAIMGLAWFQRMGHTPVAIIGGATGLIGDPSGKTSSRPLLNEESIVGNLAGIKKNLETILQFNQTSSSALLLNNYDWYKDVSFIQFLRKMGSLFRMGSMLAKDSVKTRLQSEEGMSFTEFTYQILQGYDFLYLYQNYGVTVQLGGSDQWGNITSGTELIRRVEGKSAYGITFPLLTNQDGQKFGKSEKGAIWLSAEKLSPYEFYQHLIRVEDADVIKFMRMLTFIEMDEIHRIEKQMKDPDYIPRTAQKRLADEITKLVHGDQQWRTAVQVTENISPGSAAALNVEALENLSAHMPNYEIGLEQILKLKLVDLLVEAGLQASKSEARRLIRNGGVYINNEKIENENQIIDSNSLIENRLMLVATGKKNKMLIRIREK